jgi:hypothetical protein
MSRLETAPAICSLARCLNDDVQGPPLSHVWNGPLRNHTITRTLRPSAAKIWACLAERPPMHGPSPSVRQHRAEDLETQTMIGLGQPGGDLRPLFVPNHQA